MMSDTVLVNIIQYQTERRWQFPDWQRSGERPDPGVRSGGSGLYHQAFFHWGAAAEDTGNVRYAGTSGAGKGFL